MKVTLLLLFMIFVPLPHSIYSQTIVPTLSVGDRAPKISVYKWIKGEPVADFKKGMIYVVEFGATWCTPCAVAIPELSALADEHKDSIQVLSFFVMEPGAVTSNARPVYVDRVERYVAKRSESIHYSVGVDTPTKDLETDWLSRSGEIAIPKLFVIDKNGIVAWMGNSLSGVRPVLKMIKKNSHYHQQQDSGLNGFDPFKLLLVDGNGGADDAFIFRSLLTMYDGNTRVANYEFVQSFNWAKDRPDYLSRRNRVQVIGVPLEYLYYMAYGDTLSNAIRTRSSIDGQYVDTIKRPHLRISYAKYWHRVILEVKDSSLFQWNRKSKLHRFNYSLKVPESVGTAANLQNAMRNDLRTYFGFNASVEIRRMPYWKLSVSDEKIFSKLRSISQSKEYEVIDDGDKFLFKNALVRDIITMLAVTYGYGSFDYGKLPKQDQAAFIDETATAYKIDFNFDRSKTFAETKEILKAMGLDLSKDYKLMKVIIVRD